MLFTGSIIRKVPYPVNTTKVVINFYKKGVIKKFPFYFNKIKKHQQPKKSKKNHFSLKPQLYLPPPAAKHQ